jgi:serine O-acetyltransferase
MSQDEHHSPESHSPDIGQVVAELRQARREWRASQQRLVELGGRDLPSREVLIDIVDGLRGVLFPMRLV